MKQIKKYFTPYQRSVSKGASNNEKLNGKSVLIDGVILCREVRFDLILFHGISPIVGYLMPNLFLYVKKKVLFQTFQFSISSLFYLTHR